MNFADFTPPICRIFWDAPGTLIRSRCHHSHLEEGMGIRGGIYPTGDIQGFHSRRPLICTPKIPHLRNGESALFASFGYGWTWPKPQTWAETHRNCPFSKGPCWESPTDPIDLDVNLIDFKYFSTSWGLVMLVVRMPVAVRTAWHPRLGERENL